MSAVKNTVTPMMAQFLEIKSEYKDAILFYRMGDFYEMFFDDAVAAAAALDIALTKRGKHNGDDIPMCGVPARAAETYLLALIRKGFRVAVCEQMEDPAEAKKRGYKAVVKREVRRLVTPGTLTEDSLLEARQNNYLAAYCEVQDNAAIAWVDISTGSFHVLSCARVNLSPELARLMPSELIILDELEPDIREMAGEMGIALTPLGRASFDSTSAKSKLQSLFSVGSLDAFGQFNRAEMSAMGAIVDYLEITQKGQLPLLAKPVQELANTIMQIDAATRRNLEITQSLSGGRDGSLIAAIDRTITAAGGRLLSQRISSPSCDLEKISDRQNAIGFFVENPALCGDTRQTLKSVPDMERALSRLSLDRAGPRDLVAIRNGLEHCGHLADLLAGHEVPTLFAGAAQNLKDHQDLICLLQQSLVADPGLLVRDGGFIAQGYDEELDQARKLRDEGRGIIAGLQSEYAEITGIASLKIKHNNVLGYFIETTANHAKTMLSEPLSEQFIHRQTTANAVRFTTVDLSELETKILNAGSLALEIEKRLYETLKSAVLDRFTAINISSNTAAEIDLSCAFADLALDKSWVKPIVDSSRVFEIQGGRHPVVEKALLQQDGASFVANDCVLARDDDNAHIWLVTGPNMSGKSTFLRQNAIIALLAQIGCYVPATRAHIGIVSQLFSRVGASDDLARGRSTFMVEMVETAAILNQADDRALVILDEIGRGTATYDGLSIAWATLEHLHDANKCRGLFATHYHEMSALSEKLDGVENATVTVKEWEGDVIFLHEVKMGAADRSYGVQVARLAGLPDAVVARAKTILEKLESDNREGGKSGPGLIDDLPLFSTTLETPAPAKESEIEARLKDIHPDSMTPLDALTALYELKQLEK